MAPYLTLVREDAPQRKYPLREVFNGLRYIVRSGCTWRMIPNDLPPWQIVFQQTQRWIKAGVFEAMAHDLRLLLRGVSGRKAHPSAALFDASTQSGAETMGRLNDFDMVEEGKIADLVTLECNPLEDISNARSVELVVRSGACAPGAGVPLVPAFAFSRFTLTW